ncbi:MAG: hypothetical protein EOS55_28075 [Mesorhizobium sp.]|nr:MAG: hypothetical protein EOS55_28075 [Mesorhizobium sp.]
MPEQIDYHSLPDDPRMAFATLVEIFDEQLQNDTESLDRNEDNRQALVSHMNKIMGAARALEIDLLGT